MRNSLNTKTSPMPVAPSLQRHKEVIRTENLIKSYPCGHQTCEVMHGVNLTIHHNDFTIIYGPSGSGKSTLLHALLGLEPITDGKIWLFGQRVDNLPDQEKTALRKLKFGVVYQQPIWVNSLSVIENVALPLIIQGHAEKQALSHADSCLQQVGMQDFSRYRPTNISVGQQQRVSLARAIIHNPPILVLDEPTGNLDTHASDQVLELLQQLNQRNRRTVIMVTHNLIYLPYSSRRIELIDGRIDKMELKPTALAEGKKQHS